MRALLQQSHRGPQDLVLSDRPRPEVGSGEYLIRVGAAGVNFADVTQAHGNYGGGPAAPYVAGFEAAGEVVDVGSDVNSPLTIGNHVVGVGPGAFAEYMVMPAAGVLPVPSGWSDAEALGMVLNWATAVAALRPLGGLQAGEVVLIHAAAGGVGQAAVRLARHYGVHIIATASVEKHQTVRDLGAHEVLDSASPDLVGEITRPTDGVDVVLESVGRTTLKVSLSVAKPFVGRVIVFGAASGDASLSTYNLIFEHQVQVKGLHIGALAAAVPNVYQSVLDELESLIAQGVYPPGAAEVHPLGDGPAVLQRLEARRTRGKHALDPRR
jgi:NADPH2:quinone reductase